MADYLHGIRVTESSGNAATLATIATAIIGLVATAPMADATIFPLDTPVLVSDLQAAIVGAGATGTLSAALSAISEQVRAPVVVVRVAPGADEQATELALIGTDVGGHKTGMQALLGAYALLGVRPQILGLPGLESEAVTDQLATVAAKLRGRAYCAAIGATIADVIAYRAKFAQRELTLIWPDVVEPVDVLGTPGTTPAAAHGLGLRAAIDQDQGFHKTLSNVPLASVTGMSHPISFDVQDADCDANTLNAAHVVTLVRLNGAIRFWGNRTCADPTSDFTFESACRTAQVLADTMALGLTPYLDKPLRPSLARDIVEEINELFRRLVRAGRVLGATAWFDPAKNATPTLKQGRLLISYRYTPVPPLERLDLDQEITDEFLADFGALAAANN